MKIDKKYESLVLFRILEINMLVNIHDNAIILKERDELFKLGYLETDEHTKSVRLSAKGSEKLLTIYDENKNSLVEFLRKYNGKFTIEMFLTEVDEHNLSNCDFWIDYFLYNLKINGVITKYYIEEETNTYISF